MPITRDKSRACLSDQTFLPSKYQILLLIREKIKQIYGKSGELNDFSYKTIQTQNANEIIFEIYDATEKVAFAISVSSFGVKIALGKSQDYENLVFDRSLTAYLRQMLIKKDGNFAPKICEFIIEHFHGNFVKYFKKAMPSPDDERKFLSYSGKLLRRELRDIGLTYNGKFKNLVKYGWDSRTMSFISEIDSANENIG